MKGKTTSRLIKKVKKKKEYIRNWKGQHAKNILNIKLQIWKVKMNCKKDVDNIKYLLCSKHDEHNRKCDRIWTIY